MITLTQKQRVILKHLDGMSNRSIAKEMHMSKDTVNKYITEYAEHEAFADNGRHCLYCWLTSHSAEPANVL